jgi:thiamine biosynthesis lipoprotein
VFPDFQTPAGLRREQFRAMGTTISLLLPERQAAAGAQVVRALFAEWEQSLSRFLPESELARLNRRPGERVRVSATLYTVLRSALAAARATGGLYDPTLRRQLSALGYDRTFDEVAEAAQAASGPADAQPGGGWRTIRVEPDERRVTLPEGVELDFGGIAKGMAVDAAIERLRQLGVASAVVNAGGDLAVLGLPPGGEAWPVAVAGREVSWTLPLARGALATSGIARRRWRQGEHERHHLLDPRTGLPAASDLWSVSVTADRCEQAEVAAKVAFMLGSARGADFLRRHRLAGLLVRERGAWITVDPWPDALMTPTMTAAQVSSLVLTAAGDHPNP